MLEHYVIFKPFPEHVAALAEELQAFGEGVRGTLPELIEFTWGENTNASGLAEGYTHACLARLTGPEGLTAYWVHPAHQRLLSRLDELCQKRFAIDYGIGERITGRPAA
ncbi:Dabb family protein [Acrocarpospora catenulata]|uniref:Dabb family protein n=1 Tax=Acrocarpospora catenulata TaxID=2836182 RepID=UPI001BD9954C|nr:Dabb family protein [Acrocarpospora catenulata]